MTEFAIKLLATTLLAAIGWVVVHYLTSRRDVKNKKREVRTHYLIEAFRKLESSANRPQSEAKHYWESTETALADIHLFGNKKQVELAKIFAQEINDHGHAGLDALLQELRKDLRHELGLHETNERLNYLRYKRGN